MIIKKTTVLSIIITTSVIISGCASSQQDSSSISKVFDGKVLIPDDANVLCVDNLINNSTRQEIPAILLPELRKRFNTTGRLYLSEDRTRCDVKVLITLLPLKTEPLSYNASGIPEEKRLRIDALVTLIHASSGEEVFRGRDAYAEHIYRVAGKGSISDYQGISRLTEILAERIVSLINTGWFKEDTDRKSRRKI